MLAVLYNAILKVYQDFEKFLPDPKIAEIDPFRQHFMELQYLVTKNVRNRSRNPPPVKNVSFH